LLLLLALLLASLRIDTNRLRRILLGFCETELVEEAIAFAGSFLRPCFPLKKRRGPPLPTAGPAGVGRRKAGWEKQRATREPGRHKIASFDDTPGPKLVQTSFLY
jgi:hypothetical protein